MSKQWGDVNFKDIDKKMWCVNFLNGDMIKINVLLNHQTKVGGLYHKQHALISHEVSYTLECEGSQLHKYWM